MILLNQPERPHLLKPLSIAMMVNYLNLSGLTVKVYIVLYIEASLRILKTFCMGIRTGPSSLCHRSRSLTAVSATSPAEKQRDWRDVLESRIPHRASVRSH